MTLRGIFAGGRAEQRDRFSVRVHCCKFGDHFLCGVPFHLLQVTPLIFGPADRLAVLTIVGGVQLFAGRNGLPPYLPSLVFFAESPRPVAADEHAQAVVRFDRVVPALGLDRHSNRLPVPDEPLAEQSTTPCRPRLPSIDRRCRREGYAASEGIAAPVSCPREQHSPA